MGKFIQKLDKKKNLGINEMNENHPSIYTRADKKADIPTPAHCQNRQNPEKGHWRDWTPDKWKRIADRNSYCGAVAICGVLQPFAPLFTTSRKGKLPKGGCLVPVGGEWYDFTDISATLLAMEHDWTQLAEVCNRANRPLAPKEGAALNRAREFLIWVDAAHTPTEWRDLNALVETL